MHYLSNQHQQQQGCKHARQAYQVMPPPGFGHQQEFQQQAQQVHQVMPPPGFDHQQQFQQQTQQAHQVIPPPIFHNRQPAYPSILSTAPTVLVAPPPPGLQHLQQVSNPQVDLIRSPPPYNPSRQLHNPLRAPAQGFQDGQQAFGSPPPYDSLYPPTSNPRVTSRAQPFPPGFPHPQQLVNVHQAPIAGSAGTGDAFPVPHNNHMYNLEMGLRQFASATSHGPYTVKIHPFPPTSLKQQHQPQHQRQQHREQHEQQDQRQNQGQRRRRQRKRQNESQQPQPTISQAGLSSMQQPQSVYSAPFMSPETEPAQKQPKPQSRKKKKLQQQELARRAEGLEEQEANRRRPERRASISILTPQSILYPEFRGGIYSAADIRNRVTTHWFPRELSVYPCYIARYNQWIDGVDGLPSARQRRVRFDDEKWELKKFGRNLKEMMALFLGGRTRFEPNKALFSDAELREVVERLG